MPGIGSVISTSIFNKSNRKHDYLCWLASEAYIKEGIELHLDDYVDMEDEDGREIDEEDAIDAIYNSNIFQVSKWE